MKQTVMTVLAAWAGLLAFGLGPACDSNTRSTECGDGVLDEGEACDDGPANSDSVADACRTDCRPARCGDGVIDSGEACDDGNTDPSDGCDGTCVEGARCSASYALGCGEGDSWTTATGARTMDTYPCTVSDLSAPEHVYQFVAPATSTVTVTLSELEPGVELALLVLDGSGGGCFSTGCLEVGTPQVSFEAVAGRTYYLVVDGLAGTSGTFRLDVSCAGGSCGDGVANGSEQCDDGNTSHCDGCTPACQREVCGNGIVDCAETCDDGNTVAGDGCSVECQLEGARCNPAWFLHCAGAVTASTGSGGATNVLDSYPCTAQNEGAPEFTHWFYAHEAGAVTVTLESTDTVDLLVLQEDGTHGCVAAACVEAFAGTGAPNEQHTFNVSADRYYYLVVEGTDPVSSTFTLTLDCASNPSCANGVLEPGESCDDGNTTSGDGCDSWCALEDGSCYPGTNLLCGSSHVHTTVDAPSLVDEYACASPSQGAPEYTYRFVAPATGAVTVELAGAGVDLDLFVLLVPFGSSCTPGNCIAHGAGAGDESVTFNARAGVTYYFVVDGQAGAAGDYEITVNCQ